MDVEVGINGGVSTANGDRPKYVHTCMSDLELQLVHAQIISISFYLIGILLKYYHIKLSCHACMMTSCHMVKSHDQVLDKTLL